MFIDLKPRFVGLTSRRKLQEGWKGDESTAESLISQLRSLQGSSVSRNNVLKTPDYVDISTGLLALSYGLKSDLTRQR